MLSFITKYPVTLVTAAVIVVLSLAPISEMPQALDVPLVDKWTHMLMYAALCIILWAEYWRCHRHESLTRHLHANALRLTALSLLCPIALGGAMELLQAFATTYRSGEWLDMAANSIGVAIGTAVGICIGRFVRAR